MKRNEKKQMMGEDVEFIMKKTKHARIETLCAGLLSV